MWEVWEWGWDEFDIVFVMGDVYIDYLSFVMLILGWVLEVVGFCVVILS